MAGGQRVEDKGIWLQPTADHEGVVMIIGAVFIWSQLLGGCTMVVRNRLRYPPG